MNLSAPTMPVWVVAVIAGGLGILGKLVVIPAITPYAFWLVAIGFLLLLLGSVLKGM
ncbi:MAG: hypothetical protein KJ914_14190 [Gammaproteobacteria bacterium]|nr:hypothetical protein [Gammaproteobacteria bacterium]MBU1725756.1 hypothetical protein [Gammaproteobacteria bacterium]MBU2006940.1 hypothetical protein [Gammaproteobacteria bacterium]